MSLRSVFLLAVTLAFANFCVIMFVLRPLHGVPKSYYSGARPRHTAVIRCKEPRYQPPGPAVALVSYPGSGNTWLRYLLQQATGILTGSTFWDEWLQQRGFPAENVTDGTVLVVKTHDPPPPNKYEAAILLIRNPRDAILADFNRHHKGHIDTAPSSAFGTSAQDPKKIEWTRFVPKQLSRWESLHALWLSRFAGRVLVVLYDALVRDTRQALRDILGFLNHTVPEEDMTCVVLNKEGWYRRRNKLQDLDPFSADMYVAMAAARARVAALIADYHRRHNVSNGPSIRDLLAQ